MGREHLNTTFQKILEDLHKIYFFKNLTLGIGILKGPELNPASFFIFILLHCLSSSLDPLRGI